VSTSTARPVRDVRHLGDFTVTPRMLYVVALAVPIGVVSAGASWCLLRLIGVITNAVFFQRLDSDLVAPGGDHPAWLILSAPVVGGLVIGVMARYGSERIRGHGMPETIEAILLGGSRMQPRVAVLKPIASAIAIGTGGPFGAEGPIIATGGALGSLFAQLLHLTADERKTLLVAGAASGMAATFNSPLAAITLAVELLLFEWRPRSLVPVATAVSVATLTRYPLLGKAPTFPSEAHLHLTFSTYPLALVSGVLAGLLAVVATALVYASEDVFHRLPLHWMWWPAIGGLVIGLGGLVVPQALGVGYDVIRSELTGSISTGLVVGILVVKTLIWSLSLGSGTSGGVLAPMFMIGGALGSVEALVFPSVGAGFWPLIALAGVLGGVMRSPFTGVLFALELTHQYAAMLPLVIGAVTAFAVSSLLLKRSVLTEKIARRGYHLSREYDVDPLEVLFVSEVMTSDILELDADADVTTAVSALGAPEESDAGWRQRLYPVVDHGSLIGVVTRRELLSAEARGDGAVALADLVNPAAVATHPDATLRQVSEEMAVAEVSRVVVVDRDDPRTPVGVVTLSQLLAARKRDQQEARERERVLRPRLVGPRRSPSRVNAVVGAAPSRR
jgi:H+/Cl- antiporter ClcA/CBS domain-containing protein